MHLIGPAPEPGQIVRVRQRQYLVEEVVPPPASADSTLVRMACLDDDAQGQPLEVLWENEVDPEVLTGEAWHSLSSKGFDPPKLFSAYLHTLRWNCVTAANPRLFQAPFRAGIEIDAYQLEPLRKALLLPRVNLFIADDVGLGKTIEAGLIARELLLRKKVRDIVVACPPSMLLQWKDEMETRFGLTFQILDRAYIAQTRQERGWGVNPWATHSRFLISHRLLIDEEYAAPLRDWLGPLRPGALLILDEAHHAAPSSGTKYAIDTKITRAVRDLAGRFEHRLFLSATPHNGHSNSFSALLEILDPQRFCRGVPVKGKSLLEDVMVRRLKEDIREIWGGFPKRNVVQIDIEGLPEYAPELELSRLLNEYRELREERLSGETKRKQAAAGLLISGLQQRLLSSVEAFARTLRVHRRTVKRYWEAYQGKKAEEEAVTPRLDLIVDGVGSDDDRAALSEEELQAEEDALFESASRATVGPFGEGEAERLWAKEQRLLDKMTEIAEATRALPDARVQRLVDWIRENMCPDLPELGEPVSGDPPKWKGTRVLIFTEYDDTKRYLREQLSAAITGTDDADRRIEVYHGPTPIDKREDIKRAFNADPGKHPLRILIATDAAREGINLQNHCCHLFHFDVPWNPSRMEQRNGRIDRKLQRAPEVFCHYFVYKQRPEDRILQVLVRKTETIKQELGSLAQVLEARLKRTLDPGIRHRDVERLVSEIEQQDLEEDYKRTVAEELEEARQRQDELRDEVDHLRNRIEESKQWIGLEEAHFRSAISCALELLGAESLRKQASVEDVSEWDAALDRFEFPALGERSGADPSWAETMDTLRASRRRDQKLWEWRRDSPIRPVVFEDPGLMTDEVVHLHLEHRVVQRLLGRFRAQGFVYDDLSRACFVHTSDAIPRVVLLGRLCLYGPGATRLHEELIPVAARWREPSRRSGALQMYAKTAERMTLGLLEDALLPRRAREPSDTVLGDLRSSGPQDVRELLPQLEARALEVAESVKAQLADRGEREANGMAAILEAQKRRIESTAATYATPQLRLKFGGDEAAERRQLESNRRHWDKRLIAIEEELRTEPARIREHYEVRAQRTEPVGLVYLWPETG